MLGKGFLPEVLRHHQLGESQSLGSGALPVQQFRAAFDSLLQAQVGQAGLSLGPKVAISASATSAVFGVLAFRLRRSRRSRRHEGSL